jgi:cytoskeletal protein CcmA (bactofilin family)
MAWFKKSEDGDSDMTNANSNGRPTPQEPTTARPEPREPRVDPRVDSRIEPRTPTVRMPDARSHEPRAPEVRSAEPRVAETRAIDTAPRASVLGPTLKFRGELSAQEDLIIQGSVEGSITHTQSLTVGTDGTMKGDIRARVIVIDGKVEGDLYATESVSIRATAKVKGNVFAPRVGITEGAFFQGQVEMQPSGAAVQEHSARLRQAAQAMPSTSIDAPAVEKLLSAS